jgi:homoserine O-acetyltransferase
MDQSLPAHHHISFPEGLTLECGQHLAPVVVAYRTYGSLNAQRSNAVLVCHALTGDQYVAEAHPVTGKAGWWGNVVGPGRPIDTDRFFVVCSNVLGGCMGSTGPLSPRVDRAPWGPDFPPVTIGDMVRWASTNCSAWSAARWAACRCCNGPRASLPVYSQRCRSRRRHIIRRRT